ncbi:hypothetical protein, partial [Photorhabdus sp. RM71S]|uniref:hypothetical protein n=1 Tax=Photorhabdus sp. RM71S TaxID=3342824 RepID=UPI0036D85B30
AINRTFNRHFPSSMVFEFNTFNALAAYISKQLPADSEDGQRKEAESRPERESDSFPRHNEPVAVTGMASRCAGA